MIIDYKVNCRITSQQLAELFLKSTIERPVNESERLQKMIDYSNLIISAWDGNKLVGIARSITDFAYCCYISDLAVDKEYQFKGIGKQLIEKLKSELDNSISIVLFAAPSAMKYYPKIGLEPKINGFTTNGTKRQDL